MDNFNEYLSNCEEIRIISENEKGSVKLVFDKAAEDRRIIKEVKGLRSDIYHQLIGLQHENMPKTFAVCDDGDKYYIVQEYIKGITLYEKLTETGKLPPKDVKQYMLQLCSVLKYLHKQIPPIIHRDIKPSNLMLSNDNTIKLIDFDASREIDELATKDTRLLVTDGFAPPEQYGFSQTDVRSDIYSAGKLMYTLLTGNTDDNIKSYRGRFRKIVTKCTKLDPTKRYPSADKLAQDLKKLYSIKHVIFKTLYCAAICMFLVFTVSYILGNNIPEKTAYSWQQYRSAKELPYPADKYIGKIQSSAFMPTADSADSRYRLGEVFYEGSDTWRFEITDEGKRHVILSGFVWLPYFESEVSIVFEIEDSFDYEIVEVDSDYLGVLTSQDDINGFLFLVDAQIRMNEENNLNN